ncbi:hypothetical protein [Evansella vedderi]|uniref:hypothetical protein n=1 Tax=Evansella vedderi TaxID=38282 RepID=UPI0027D84626|nr:hypothetical protein [Evansella vedderi]
MKLLIKSFMLSILLLGLSACNLSQEQVLEHAKESFNEKMNQEPKTITYETKNMSLYIPSFTEVDVIDEYNLILERNDHVFLLFLNDHTDFESKDDLLELMMLEQDPFIFEIDEVDGEKAYLIVTHFSENEYKVIVGYNGRKITTITTLQDMNNVAETMFDIVQSAMENNE